MNPSPLLPAPDVIPAPAWLFHVLGTTLFTLHILLINIILGGSAIMLFRRFSSAGEAPPFSDALAHKLPVLFALGITMGVAPLLFVQVILGHLFYTSSILMAVWWILVIPLLILAYYGAYVHAKSARPVFAGSAIAAVVLILLYIAFVYVNNLLMMMQPAKWSAYFANRGGTLLVLPDPTLLPRYLHFVTASVAIAGLFFATVWTMRKNRGIQNADANASLGLKIFGYATVVQVAIGFWFLISLNREFMLQFMGGDLLFTVIFALGFFSGLGAIATAFAGKLRPSVIQAAITVVAMVITRDNLRTLYLQSQFDPSTLQVNPQYGVMALFFVILIIGLACVAWMVKAGFANAPGRAAQ